MALTQLPAVEPLRWGLRGVAAQCFVCNRFFRISFFLRLKTFPSRKKKLQRIKNQLFINYNFNNSVEYFKFRLKKNEICIITTCVQFQTGRKLNCLKSISYRAKTTAS
ncbi:MAG: hypothetical protein RLZZ628_3182 [Bacteroidota bacterium]|jgi:hypothetical protein